MLNEIKTVPYTHITRLTWINTAIAGPNKWEELSASANKSETYHTFFQINYVRTIQIRLVCSIL